MWLPNTAWSARELAKLVRLGSRPSPLWCLVRACRLRRCTCRLSGVCVGSAGMCR